MSFSTITGSQCCRGGLAKFGCVVFLTIARWKEPLWRWNLWDYSHKHRITALLQKSSWSVSLNATWTLMLTRPRDRLSSLLVIKWTMRFLLSAHVTGAVFLFACLFSSPVRFVRHAFVCSRIIKGFMFLIFCVCVSVCIVLKQLWGGIKSLHQMYQNACSARVQCVSDSLFSL